MTSALRQTLIAGLAGLLILAAAPGRARAQAGSLDPSFGTGGIAHIGVGYGSDYSRALARQSDGKLLVAGSTSHGNQSYLVLARYSSSGVPDPTFGDKGVMTLFDRPGSFALGVLQYNGKIIVAGGVGQDNLLARFHEDGSIDLSYGVDGFAVFSDSLEFHLSAMTRQGDQILVAGAANLTTVGGFAVCRFGSNGYLDPSFDGDGHQSTVVLNTARPEAIALQPDGKIVLVGSAHNTSNRYCVVLVRYDANGTLDTTFDGDGRVTTFIGTSTQHSFGLAIVPQVWTGNPTKLIVAGRTGPPNLLTDALLVRYNLDGSLDPVFGSGGVVVQAVSAGADAFRAVGFVPGTTREDPPRIVAAGYMTPTGGSYDALLCRYRIGGTLETGFGGGDGIVTTPIGTGQDEIWAMLTSSSQLTVTGYVRNGDEGQNLMLVRFLTSTGAFDTSFDGDGILLDDVGDAEAAAHAMARQPDGRIVLAGWYNSGNGFAMVRLRPDGSPDSTFSSDGRTSMSVGTSLEYFEDVAVQPDLKIVASGSLLLSNQWNLLLARYLADGSLDPSFNGTGILTTRLGQNDEGSSVAIQPDGRILLSGTTTASNVKFIRVSRYLSNGLADASFATSGHFQTLAGGSNAIAHDISLQSDGRIVIAGRRKASFSQIEELIVLRLTSAGALDPSFGVAGVVNLAYTTTTHAITDVLVQPDGRILITGITGTSLDRNPWLLRLDREGRRDPTFGDNGYRVLSTNSLDETVAAAAMQPDGRIVVVGKIGSQYLSDQLVLRVEADGAPDVSFAAGGLLSIDTGPSDDDAATDVDAGGSGPILVAGTGYGLMTVAALNRGGVQTGVGETPPPALPTLAVGRPWPSPTRSGMSMTLMVEEPSHLDMDVLDVSGRLIRRLGSSESLPAGEHRIAWDGQDASGAPVAAGSYFVRVRRNDDVVTRRVVVVR